MKNGIGDKNAHQTKHGLSALEQKGNIIITCSKLKTTGSLTLNRMQQITLLL